MYMCLCRQGKKKIEVATERTGAAWCVENAAASAALIFHPGVGICDRIKNMHWNHVETAINACQIAVSPFHFGRLGCGWSFVSFHGTDCGKYT